MAKKSRSLKVYGMSGYRYREDPAIVLKGQWLSALGFKVGDYISVSCEDGRIVITPDDERAALRKRSSFRQGSFRLMRSPVSTGSRLI